MPPLNQYPTFHLAHQLRGFEGQVLRRRQVLNVSKLGVKDFDVVIYCGIYYYPGKEVPHAAAY